MDERKTGLFVGVYCPPMSKSALCEFGYGISQAIQAWTTPGEGRVVELCQVRLYGGMAIRPGFSAAAEAKRILYHQFRQPVLAPLDIDEGPITAVGAMKAFVAQHAREFPGTRPVMVSDQEDLDFLNEVCRQMPPSSIVFMPVELEPSGSTLEQDLPELLMVGYEAMEVIMLQRPGVMGIF